MIIYISIYANWKYDFAAPVKRNLRDIILFFSIPAHYWTVMQESPGVSFFFGASGQTSFRLADRRAVADTEGERIVGLE